ncbi:MAG TPA: type VI secretion system tube protein TssD [Puia sp.]|nr:type VI secretion system tube protein TssD [Puia sp.]
MSFKAILDVGGKTFDLLYCSSEVFQKTDSSGRPVSGVHAGYIWFVIEGTDDDTFSSWASDPTKKQDGTVTFYRIDQDSTFKKIEFKGAYLNILIESFIVDEDISDPMRWGYLVSDLKLLEEIYELIKDIQVHSNTSYAIFFRLSAEKVKIDGVDHDNKW